VFQTFPMNVTEWGMLLLLSASIIPAVEVLKVIKRLVVRA
jgi:hypothetical protein